jgi:phasin
VVDSAAAATARIVPPEVAKMFEAPAKSMTEMQEKMRAMIEKGIAETRGVYTKAKSAADETNSALEASFVTAKTGAVEINSKVLEALRASADANFDFVKSILGVKSIADYVTLHSEFARKQIETLTGQTKEIAALAQKVATDSAEPIKTRVAKTFKIAS